MNLFNPRIYLSHHRHALIQGFRQLTRTPIATLLTLAVLAITITLPSSLLVLLNNAHQLTARWNNGATITLYLPTALTDTQAQAIVAQVQLQPGVQQASYLSPEQGMAQFQQASGFEQAFVALEKNPLPGVIEVVPSDTQPLAMQQLKLQLQQIKQVTDVNVDLQWVQRLFSIITLSKNIVHGLLLALSIAMLLIVGNTIRMTVQRYQRHIDVMHLIGATRAFIRRPFLYAGALYGLFAGVIAALILTFITLWLQTSVRELALQYNSNFSLDGLSNAGLCILLGSSSLLGYVGAWLAVRFQRR